MPEIYPQKNRQEGLTYNYHSIRRRVGSYLGHGISFAQWPDDVRETVDDIMREGTHRYYFPDVIPEPYAQGATEPHQWTWMRPTHEFSTQANQRRYSLPQDFDSMIGDITYPDDNTTFYSPIRQTSPQRLRSLEFETQFTSYPQFAALEPQESQGDSPQEQLLVLHPTPDNAYTLKFQYQSYGREMSAEHPYPLGGQIHGRGILAACLAVAESRKSGDPDGPLNREFMRILVSNITRDYHRGAQLLGYWQNSGAAEYNRGRIRERLGIFYSDPLYNGQSFPGG